MATRTQLTNNQIRSMSAKYRKGATAEELASEFDLSVSTVLRILRNANVEIRSRGRRPSEG